MTSKDDLGVIIVRMVDVIRIRRLLKTVVNDSGYPLFPLDIGSAQKSLKAKYKSYDTSTVNSIIRMAKAEEYIKLSDKDVFGKVLAWKDQYVTITDVKGQRLLGKAGLIEFILSTYSKTANFVSGALFLAALGLMAHMIRMVVESFLH